jgi:hypothetical protein
MKKYLAYSVYLIFIISAGFVFAEIKSLVKEYTYQASEAEGMISRSVLRNQGSYP